MILFFSEKIAILISAIYLLSAITWKLLMAYRIVYKKINAQSVCYSHKIISDRVIKTDMKRERVFVSYYLFTYISKSHSRCLFTYYSLSLFILFFFSFYFGRKYNLDISSCESPWMKWPHGGLFLMSVTQVWVWNCEHKLMCVI